MAEGKIVTVSAFFPASFWKKMVRVWLKKMERLSVYEDYVQTMAFLRASRNRVFNAIETSNVENGDKCTSLCKTIYDTHVANGLALVIKLEQAMQTRNLVLSTSLAQELHRHNRETARVSRLFEEDVSDYHADEDTINKNIKPSENAVKTETFIDKLETYLTSTHEDT